MTYHLSTKELLAELFVTISEHEVEVEAERCELADRASFIPFQAFKRLDRKRTGEISEGDIIAFCEENGVKCTYHDAEQVITQYDESGSGKLIFTEFNQLVLPTTNETLRMMVSTRHEEESKPRETFLMTKVESGLANIFKKEIEYQRTTEELKRQLGNRRDFITKTAFDWLDQMEPKGKVDR